MPAKVSRTLNPLHFEDLEPHRFEDLVRQLLYDFRPWRALEPTGRLGADEGFDVRGLEIDVSVESAQSNDEDEGDGIVDLSTSRVWLIQCKREQNIGPKKLASYLDEISELERQNLHGIIFVSACDFSKKAHDDFRSWCFSNGLNECYLWGKAALEDMLFQPKNDHLLFAYFGFSLSMRRRSQKTQLRSNSTTKRKLKKIIDSGAMREVIIRDAADNQYPFLTDVDLSLPPPERKNHWRVYKIDGLSFRGLGLVCRRYFAFKSGENEDWDVANTLNDAVNDDHIDKWNGLDFSERWPERQKIFEIWDAFQPHEKAWIEVVGYIRYEDILEVDEVGDELTSFPHVFVNWKLDSDVPFYAWSPKLETIDAFRGVFYPRFEDRIQRFPEEMRKEIEQR